jgi:hypothetical protein
LGKNPACDIVALAMTGDDPQEEHDAVELVDEAETTPVDDGEAGVSASGLSSREKPLARLGRSILPPSAPGGSGSVPPHSPSTPPSGKLSTIVRDAIGARPKGPPPLPADAIARSMQRPSEPPSPFHSRSSPPPPRQSPLPPRPSSPPSSPSRSPSVPPYRTTSTGAPAPGPRPPMEDRVASLGTKLADLEPRLDVWQSRVDRFEAFVNDARAELASWRASIDELRAAVAGFDDRLAAVEGFEGRLAAVEGFDGRLVQAEAKALAVESKFGAFRAAADALEHRVAMIELPPSPDVVVDTKRVTRLEARIAMLEASSRSLTDRVDDSLGAAKKKAEDDALRTLRASVDELKQRVDSVPAPKAAKPRKAAAKPRAAKLSSAANGPSPGTDAKPKRATKKRR